MLTSLVILMLNRKRGKLDNMLKAISERKDSFGMSVDVSSDRGPGKRMLENLKTLLIFWQEHYLNKDKDCTQLEKSSRIPFEFWKSTVQLLTSENMFHSSSLLYYINNGTLQNNE